MGQQQHLRKKQKPNIGRIIIIILAAILGLYVIVQIVSAFSGGIKTVTTTRETENNSIFANGWIFRNETPIASEMGNVTVKHLVYSGERVQQNAPLAMVFTSDIALDLNQQIESLDSRITLLDAALASAGDVSDAAKIDQQITQTLQQLAVQIKSGAGTSLSTTATSLRSLSLKREAGSLDTNELNAERSELVSQRDSLSQQLNGQTTQIDAPTAGYFSEVIDGYEEILKSSLVDTMTLEQYKELIAGDPAEASEAMLGKIVQGFTWYLAAELPAEDASRLKAEQKVTLSFTQSSVDCAATVYRIVPALKEGDHQLVIFATEEVSGELLALREQPVEIILQSYTGLKVPKQAVRVMQNEDGTTSLGVFILSGSVTRFKKITPLYEADTFYIVEQSATDNDALVDKDQIVVQGKALQNNMVVS